MRKPLVTLCDASLPPPVFAAVRNGVLALKEERLRTSYQTTFWYRLGDRPTNRVEDAVVRLFHHLPGPAQGKVEGVEWWLSRMRTSNVQVDFHRDRDNALFARTGRERNPVLSSVLYLNTCVGGLLAVTKEPPNPDNPAFAPDVHDFDFVEPKPNRFTFFPAKLTHGVLDSKNCIPGAKRKREPALRLAIAINWWDRRPEAVPTFPETGVYRALARGRLASL